MCGMVKSLTLEMANIQTSQAEIITKIDAINTDLNLGDIKNTVTDTNNIVKGMNNSVADVGNKVVLLTSAVQDNSGKVTDMANKVTDNSNKVLSVENKVVDLQNNQTAHKAVSDCTNDSVGNIELAVADIQNSLNCACADCSCDEPAVDPAV